MNHLNDHYVHRIMKFCVIHYTLFMISIHLLSNNLFMCFCLFTILCIYSFSYLLIYFIVYFFDLIDFLFFYSFICSFISLLILFNQLFIYLFIYLYIFMYLYIYLFVYLSIYLLTYKYSLLSRYLFIQSFVSLTSIFIQLFTFDYHLFSIF